jgi:hypothetical protein
VPKKRLSKSSLLWFIRSRSYVSIPDLRRRFNLEVGDEVHPVATVEGRIYVGLPSDAARALGDLVREGRVGLELRPGLLARVAIGVYVIPQSRDRFLLPGQTQHEPADLPYEEEDDMSAVAQSR